MSQTFTYRPPSFITLPDQQLKNELDKAIPRIYDAHAALASTAIVAPVSGAGFAVVSGSATVTGSKLRITTGLKTVTQVVASIDSGANATNSWAVGTVTPANHSTIDLYVWSPTSSGDNTPIASVVPTVVNYWCTGVASS